MTGTYRSERGAAQVAALYREILDAWPVANRQLRVATRQGETFVVVCGKSDGPPLVLLHGSGSNAAMWASDVPAWAGTHCIFAVDLIGDPGLSAPARPPLDSGAYPLWLDDVLDALELPSVALVGFSLGGWLAADYAARRPARVARLVLLSTGGIGRQRASFLFRMLPLLLFGAWGRRRALAIASGIDSTGQSDRARRYTQFLLLVQQAFRRRMDPLPQLSDAALGRLRMPLLCIVGERDVILDSAGTLARLRHFAPHAELVCLPAVGHAITGQAARILEFLVRRVDRAPR